MELVNHIRDLLYHHDCVIVPGFGGFVTNERSARIEMATNSFYPPSRGVGFNARLDHNDGLLISYLSAKLSMNYVDTKNLVREFAGEVDRRLESGRTVLFDGIGQFSSDRDGNLQFDPDPSANFLTDAYGLSFFRYPALEKTEPGRRIRKKIDEGRTGIRAGARKLLRYAAIGIPLVAALTWGAMNTDVIREFSFDLSSINPFAAVVDSGIRTSPAADGDADDAYPDESVSMRRALMYHEDTDAMPADQDLYDTAGEAAADALPEAVEHPELLPAGDAGPEPFEQAEVLPAIAPPIAAAAHETAAPAAIPSRMHYLVAGSFKNMQNALLLRDSLLSEGYSSEIIAPENGFYRVFLFASHDPAEALQMLRQVRAMDRKEDIWMLSR